MAALKKMIDANAQPEKRLFIGLITRDISLIDALLDLIDNSINAALEPLSNDLNTAADYQRLLSAPNLKPKVKIEIAVGSSRIAISDNAGGISSRVAADHVFKFGRDSDSSNKSDRLSVYGIGLKRALFKCGNKIHMISDHKDGGFELNLNVSEWAKVRKEPWTFAIEPRPHAKTKTGTQIVITELHDDVIRRINDGIFANQLRERISRTYAVFIDRIIEILLNNKPISKEPLEIGKNYSSESFKSGEVTCTVTAGLAVRSGEQYQHKNAGWYVFCNGRAVLFADKSDLTGWGVTGLPIFQPKHRPFLGTVFFVSPNPEELPWNTTKSSVNEESIIWQEAKRHMLKVGREVVRFLDQRYTEAGTTVSPADLQDATKGSVSLLQAALERKRSFTAPKKPPAKETRIQYSVKVSDLKKIENYLQRPGMGGSEVGRYTFSYFLKNEVGG